MSVEAPVQPELEVRNLRKAYGHVEALRGVDLDVRPGEVVGLVGDNGAGKSTLIKVLSGVDEPDQGEILIRGERVRIPSPSAAKQFGIDVVFQDLALAPELSAVDNFFLGREITRSGVLGKFGFLDRKAMLPLAKAAFADYGLDLTRPEEPVATLSGGQKQSVAVIRSVATQSSIVFMDEPTAALGVVQTRKVLEVIRRVKDRGSSVVLISHDIPNVLEIADRIHVLRLGRRVATFAREQAGLESLVDAIAGVDRSGRAMPESDASEGAR